MLAPTWLLLGEFSGAFAHVCETQRGVIALSVDLREPEREGLHFCGAFHEVIDLVAWDFVAAWPNCTHTAYSNGALRVGKSLDGRAFWGHVGVLYTLLAGKANGRMVEQPDSDFGRLFPTRRVRCQTDWYGDAHSKTVVLYLIGVDLSKLPSERARALGATAEPPSSHLRRPAHWEFPDAEARDRFRSSWEHFPLFMAALVACLQIVNSPPTAPSFEEGLESFSCAWHDAGWPVPEGYELCSDGLPVSTAAREYQALRGPGDGRRPSSVIPRSRRAGLQASAARRALSDEQGWPAERVLPDQTTLGGLAAAQVVTLADLSANGVALFFIATLMQPLVFAHVNGLDVLGAELPVGVARATPMRLLERWAELAFSLSAAACTFMIGRYGEAGPRVGVCLLPFLPPPADVVRSAAERRARLRRGATFLWCTLACMAGTPLADPIARALAGVGAFAGPVMYTADALHEGELINPVFRVGASPVASMMGMRPISYDRLSVGHWMLQDAHYQQLLRRELELGAQAGEVLLEGWAERIQPPPQELLDLVQIQLPDMLAADLLSMPYSPMYEPPKTAYLPRMPAQLPFVAPSCVLSAMELLTEGARGRVHAWLTRVLDQLVCIELQQPDCELRRPHPLVLGQEAMLPWARGRVWDFTFERAPCAVLLDMTLPIDTHLNLDFLRRRLAEYPDQNMLSHLVEGVRFEADVELQSVLVPHLISLPKGFTSVRNELYRLQTLGWYRFFDRLPFWPIYLNGQGATSRKLEERYRRTTECGGPRRPTFDEAGLRALSINEAALVRHMPAWYHFRHDPPWLKYLQDRQLDKPLEWGMPSGRPREIKPTLTAVMRDLSILLAAARQLEEPLYVFGDDAKDYFNQLAMASEEWWKVGVVFLHADDLAAPRSAGERLFFVSERRLGFGASPSSNIAQRFSEALLHLLREDMDAAEASLPPDTRPSAERWRAARSSIRRDSEAEQRAQLRLYFAHMYTDDPIVGVVGVRRAIRLVLTWKRLVTELRLIMAIP